MTSPHPAPRHALATAPMRLAFIGAAGEPVEGTPAVEIGRRLAARGHDVIALPADRASRARDGGRPRSAARVARIVRQLAAVPRLDVVLVFDPACAAVLPLLRGRGAAVAVHLDDGPLRSWEGSRRARLAERTVVREADALLSSTRVVAERFEDRFRVPVEHVPDGARIVRDAPTDALRRVGLEPGGFHLTVASDDQRSRTDAVLAAYRRSAARLPLVVLPAPTANGSLDLRVRDHRIRVLEPVRDERVLDQLFAHAASSVHAGPLGGTEASVLRAMGAGTAIVAVDAPVNRELAGTAGSYFGGVEDLTLIIDEVERYAFRFRDIGELMQERARRRHDWDIAAESVEALAARLTRGSGSRGTSTWRQRRPVAPLLGATGTRAPAP